MDCCTAGVHERSCQCTGDKPFVSRRKETKDNHAVEQNSRKPAIIALRLSASTKRDVSFAVTYRHGIPTLHNGVTSVKVDGYRLGEQGLRWRRGEQRRI